MKVVVAKIVKSKGPTISSKGPFELDYLVSVPSLRVILARDVAVEGRCLRI